MTTLKVEEIAFTPNPDALKFILSHTLVANGSKSYSSPEGARKNPLAGVLFALDGVDSVFMMERFVTVNKRPDAEWGGLREQIVGALEAADAPTQGPEAAAPQDAPGAGQDALLRRINQILDEQVRPGLAMDGGGLQILALDGHTLSIHYQGACGSCPSSIMGTLMAIESLLRDTVDPRLAVIAA